MRAAAFFAATLVLMGAWIVIGAAFGLGMGLIGTGLLMIAIVAAVALLATAPAAGSPSGSAVRSRALNAAD